jgi:dTDP-4-amino-4,6-dideoxygalactose transaminase
MDTLTQANLHQAISQGASGNADIVGNLQAAFADLVHARFALCTASGTAVLSCALRVAGVRPGDPVAVSALGPAMTGLAVTALGARPVFSRHRPRRTSEEYGSPCSPKTTRTTPPSPATRAPP